MTPEGKKLLESAENLRKLVEEKLGKRFPRLITIGTFPPYWWVHENKKDWNV